MTKMLMEESKAFLADVPPEYVFWCSDGRVLRNLKELADALAAMSDETFAHHANTEKNDFSRWVKDIIKDEWLAKSLERTTISRMDSAKKVTNRIVVLTKRLD